MSKRIRERADDMKIAGPETAAAVRTTDEPATKDPPMLIGCVLG